MSEWKTHVGGFTFQGGVAKKTAQGKRRLPALTPLGGTCLSIRGTPPRKNFDSLKGEGPLRNELQKLQTYLEKKTKRERI